MLKLEAGKRYWRRDGGVSAALRHDTRSIDSYSEYTDDFGSWSVNGRIYGRNESPFDLIREYTEPQPLEWKRGIPTEQECRECWLIVGGDGERPFRIGAHCHGPDATKQRHWKEADWYLPLRIKPVEPPKPKTRTVTLQQFTHTSGDRRWMVVEDGEMAGCWTATGKTKTVEVPCE